MIRDEPHPDTRPTPVAGAPRCELGESPRWDATSQRLWWVDLLAGLVHRLDPVTGRHDTTDLGVPVSALAQHTDGWVVAVETGVQFRDNDFALLAEVPVFARSTGMRMNDAMLDPCGRFVVGTLAYDGRAGAGTLYRIDPDGAVTVLLDGLDVSNGIVWTADGTCMLHVDSGARTIRSHDYDLATGTLGAAQLRYEHPRDGAVPDGIALDSEGGLWVALWGGGRVVRVDETGAITDEVVVPAAQPAGVAFGGADLRTLFVTSARVDLDESELAARPANGRLFACRPGVQGQAQKLVRVTPTIRSSSSTRNSAR